MLSILGYENISYRIKSKDRIFEKILYNKANKEKYSGLSEIEILKQIKDIIGMTVVSTKLEDSYKIADNLVDIFGKKSEIQFTSLKDYINNESRTGYKGLLLWFENPDKVPFEIQVTDPGNVLIQDGTHEAFEQSKYSKIRKGQKENEEKEK